MNTYSLSVLGSESSSFIFSNKGVVDFSSKVDARKTNKVIHESYIVKGEMLFNWGEFVDPNDLVSFQKPNSFREVTIPHFWGKDKNAKK